MSTTKNQGTFKNYSFEVPYISPRGITITKQYLFSGKKYRYQDEEDEKKAEEIRKERMADRTALIKQRRKDLEGVMSEQSRKKMCRAIQWLEFSASKKKVWLSDQKKFVKFKLNFITLTLPVEQDDTDNEIKHKCLNSFLTELRKFHGVKNYIWRAEKQANGNIHFHLVTDAFINHAALRRRWNRIINVLGYVDRYSKKMRESIKTFGDYYNRYIDQGSYMQLLRRYNSGKANNWTNPNTTDVHSTKKVKNMVAYLSKYMAKSIESPELLTPDLREQLLVKGRIWGLSESLSNFKSIEVPHCHTYKNEIDQVWEMAKRYEYRNDFFVFRTFQITEIYKHDLPHLQKLISEIIRERFNPAFDALS